MPKKSKPARAAKPKAPAKSSTKRASLKVAVKGAAAVKKAVAKGAKLIVAAVDAAISAPAAAIANDAVKVQLLAVDKIEESKLNPRKTRDPQKVADLAESIAVKGVQQPLKVRPHPKKAGKFEIVFGGSRLAAIGQLVEAGRAPASYKVPVIVDKVSDTELIELALVENIQRADMSPLEEGEAFVALRDKGGSTETVAGRLGKSQKWVQMRISLVERLAPKVKDALRAGEITLFEAQAFFKGEPKRQVELLHRVKQGWIRGGEAIVRQMTAENPSVKVANFPVKDYEAAGGELIADEEGNAGGPWFKDVALFERLQREAVERTEAKLKENWAWVKIVSHAAGEHFKSWEFKESKDPKKAGAVIEIDHDSKVKVHTGLVAKGEAKSPVAMPAKKAAAKEKTGAEPPQITQPLMLKVKHEKTKALQNAIAFDALRPGKAALVLTCIGLMGERDVVRIQPAEIRSDDEALSPLVRDALEGFRAQLDGLLKAAPRGKDAAEGSGILELKEGAGRDAFNRMMDWPTDTVLAFYACLVAPRCGTFNDYRPELGDDPLAIAIAEALGVNMAEAWGKDPANWSAYLQLLKKSRAMRLVGHMPGLALDAEELEKAKTGAVVQQIEVALELHPEQRAIVPPELTFAACSDIEKAINKAPAKRQGALALAEGDKKAGKAEKSAKGGNGKSAANRKGKGAKAGGRKPAAAEERPAA